MGCEKREKFCINDHRDLVMEILKRVDYRSLGVAACVCKQWCSITRNESFWENLCFRNVSYRDNQRYLRVRNVVAALGGYRRLYMLLLSRLGDKRKSIGRGSGGALVRDEVHVQLSLSLFCVDYYERLGNGGGGGGGKYGADAPESSSLMFLCNPVNV